jgi:hypothetical protein
MKRSFPPLVCIGEAHLISVTRLEVRIDGSSTEILTEVEAFPVQRTVRVGFCISACTLGCHLFATASVQWLMFCKLRGKTAGLWQRRPLRMFGLLKIYLGSSSYRNKPLISEKPCIWGKVAQQTSLTRTKVWRRKYHGVLTDGMQLRGQQSSCMVEQIQTWIRWLALSFGIV